MRNTSYSMPGLISSRSAVDDKKVRWPSILAAVISALHHSRRLQAQRTILQYQHLIARPGGGPQTEAACRNEDISQPGTVP
jgi:hypothetical protein